MSAVLADQHVRDLCGHCQAACARSFRRVGPHQLCCKLGRRIWDAWCARHEAEPAPIEHLADALADQVRAPPQQPDPVWHIEQNVFAWQLMRQYLASWLRRLPSVAIFGCASWMGPMSLTMSPRPSASWSRSMGSELR